MNISLLKLAAYIATGGRLAGIGFTRLAPAIAAVVLIFNSQTARAADEMAAANSSALRLAAIFGDNMVLQRQQTIPVWGWTAPNANVTVKFAGQTKSTRAVSPEMLPEFWTLQSRAARQIKNTGMVVTTDLADNLDDIHPRDKQDVGHCLALLALNETYGKKNFACSGPVFKKMKIEGDKAALKFDHAVGGLASRDGQPLTWFTIAGADGKFVAADAKIAGDTVEVSAPGIEKPVAVRFAWDETAQPNLCNKAGLPAGPFRTDDPLAHQPGSPLSTAH